MIVPSAIVKPRMALLRSSRKNGRSRIPQDCVHNVEIADVAVS